MLLDLFSRLPVGPDAVGLGRRRQVKRRFGQVILPFGHPHPFEGLGTARDDGYRHWLSQPYILGRQHQQPPKNEAWIFTGQDHFRQIVERGIGSGAAHRLDERADGVIVLVARFVVLQGALLNGFLGHFQRDAAHALFVRRRGFDSQFQRVERGTRVPAGDLGQVLQRVGGDVERTPAVAAFHIA